MADIPVPEVPEAEEPEAVEVFVVRSVRGAIVCSFVFLIEFPARLLSFLLGSSHGGYVRLCGRLPGLEVGHFRAVHHVCHVYAKK